jgi:AraC family transcriptional regulator
MTSQESPFPTLDSLVEQELALLFESPPAGSQKPYQRDRPPPRLLEDPRIIKAIRLIEGALEAPLSLEQIAAHVNLSGSRFQRRFQDVMGESPAEYQRRTRLDRAAILLIITAESVMSIALSMGYASHEAFIRAFHRQFGLVPTQYRKFARQASLPLAPEDEPRVSHVRVERFPAQQVLAMRFYGSYAQVEDNWRCFAERLGGSGFSLEGCQAVGIIQDNPEITPNELVRYDCAILDDGSGREHPTLSRLTLPAARFARLEHRAPYSHIFPVYRVIGSVWGLRSGERFKPGSALERYRRQPWASQGPEQWLDVTIGLED